VAGSVDIQSTFLTGARSREQSRVKQAKRRRKPTLLGRLAPRMSDHLA
jgi:hypothetical protein